MVTLCSDVTDENNSKSAKSYVLMRSSEDELAENV